MSRRLLRDYTYYIDLDVNALEIQTGC